MKYDEGPPTEIEDLDLKVHPTFIKRIVNLQEQAWQQTLMQSLKNGPVNPYVDPEEVILGIHTDGAYITIEAYLDEEVKESLIEDIVRQGFARQDEDGTLTGLGLYAESELTWIEKKVLAVARSTKRGSITPVGVKRKLKDVKISTREIKGALNELANKGYLQQKEVWSLNPLLKKWLMTHPLSPESLNEWLSLYRGSSSNAKI